jgi:Ca-activated chloride channel family protein
MSFASPLWLLALLVVPLALLAQWLARARARRYAVRFTAMATLREAIAAGQTWRRRIPAVLLLAAMALLALGLARPRVASSVAVRRASLMLVLDHSGSMLADDVQPTRLAAAERAANTFIDQLPASVRVGVVGFSTAPDAVQAPTTNHAAARRVIDSQSASGSTDTGDALALAMQLLHQGAKPARAAIVLLSDGAANAGQNPVTVATEAARENVAIYTVALGTPNGMLANPDPYAPPVAVPPDPALMAQIADASHGRSFTAEDASRLSSIYKDLGTELASRTEHHEITAAFAAAALLLALGGLLSSQRWAGRLP